MSRARRMTAADCATALEVLALAMWIELALAVMPFSRLLQRIDRMHTRPSTIRDAAQECQRLPRYVEVAYELLPLPATCLRRSLVLHALLIRRGWPSRICLGVAKAGTSLDAHAWIECDGLAPDRANERFAELEAASQFARTSAASHV